MRWCGLLVAVLAVVGPRISTGQTGTVQYRVDLTRGSTQVATVRMRLEGISTEAVEVHLPVWRPGLYLILDQAGGVQRLSARGVGGGGSGETLSASKVNKSSWKIETRGQSVIEVEYDVWCASLENRTRHLDDTHAFLSPSTVFLYAHEWRHLPIEVELTMPAAWRVATGLDQEKLADGGVKLKAANYDVLADSPIEAGLHDLITFDVEGVPHEIAVWTGETGFAAESPVASGGDLRTTERYGKLAEQFGKIVSVQKAIFGSLPYQRYVFLLHIYPGGRGGTEHLNSTIMQVGPDALRTDEAHRRLLSLTSHEVFHTWNVKRFRPAGLTPYDYQRENYTDLLWVAEGTTSYYEDITLVRAGLLKADDYLKSLAESIDTQQRRPGGKVQSLAESSFDSWIKFGKRTADAANSTVSFYDKGALVSLLLDLEIRQRTGNVRSLDDVMKLMYERFPSPERGYTTADLKRALSEVAGDFDAFFAAAVDGTVELDYAGALAGAGLKYSTKPKAAEGGDAAGEGGRTSKPDLGVTVTDQGGLAVVSTVLSDGAGLAAGLAPGDVIIALDGRRVRGAEFEKLIEHRKAGDAVRIGFFRHDALREVTATLAARPAGKPTIERVHDATEEQKAVYKSWLGVEYVAPAAPKAKGGTASEDPAGTGPKSGSGGLGDGTKPPEVR